MDLCLRLFNYSHLVRRCGPQWATRTNATALKSAAAAAARWIWWRWSARSKVAGRKHVQQWASNLLIRTARASYTTVGNRTDSSAGHVLHSQSHTNGDSSHARRSDPATAAATASPSTAAATDPTAATTNVRSPSEQWQRHRGHSQSPGGRVRLRW